ncbi:hypothetical protein D3C84_791940 [compost metagenome]
MGVDAAQSAIARHHNHHADQSQKNTAPAPRAHLVFEHEARQQRAEQGRRLRQHAGRTGADPLLTKIDRHVMQAHRKKAEAEQQRQIAKGRQADAFEHRNQRHEHRRQQKPQQCQMPGIIGLQADVNTGRGIAPARDDEGHGQDDFEGRGGG